MELDYQVTIVGMDDVPLFTTREGAEKLIMQFESGQKMGKTLMTLLENGTKFNNPYLSIERINKPQPPSPSAPLNEAETEGQWD